MYLTFDNQGFRGDCLVFGAKPGACVSYFDFQPANSTEVSDRFNNKVTSLSVNTGGNCQWYLYERHASAAAMIVVNTNKCPNRYEGCNDKGDDRGLTSSYNVSHPWQTVAKARRTIFSDVS